MQRALTMFSILALILASCNESPTPPQQKVVVEEMGFHTDGVEIPVYSADEAKAYIERFKETALIEQKKYGIPYKISLGQGLLESGCGQSTLAEVANNHFGIKCFGKKCPKGHCVRRKDDKPTDRFVKYATAWESWRGHSKLLSNKRYKPLHGGSLSDWAYGLKKKGYATDKHYAEKLLGVIHKYID